jgi:IS30 family transposase
MYPDDRELRVSHETIYRSLFVQTRGVLKKELLIPNLRNCDSLTIPKSAEL